jgi:hypothetical protein
MTYGVLPQEDVARIPEAFVDEYGREYVACCQGGAQLAHVAVGCC